MSPMQNKALVSPYHRGDRRFLFWLYQRQPPASPGGRMEMFGQIKVDIGKILQQLCQQKGIEIIEVKLKLMPPSWAYVLARLEELNSSFQNEKVLVRNDFSSGCLFCPSVPMSVNRPFNSSKGME